MHRGKGSRKFHAEAALDWVDVRELQPPSSPPLAMASDMLEQVSLSMSSSLKWHSNVSEPLSNAQAESQQLSGGLQSGLKVVASRNSLCAPRLLDA